jgi:hypothetical protein
VDGENPRARGVVSGERFDVCCGFVGGFEVFVGGFRVLAVARWGKFSFSVKLYR